ncbi:MAG: dienelactone hydrolase family protein [Gammaproteobacteria bacterium]
MNAMTITSSWETLAEGLRAWLAKPQGIASPPGILLYIEAFGVNAHMRGVAERFAQAGYAAIIPDIFHGKTFEYDDIEHALPVVRELDDQQVMRESVETLACLAAAGMSGKPAVAGYCMGGRLAFLAGIELGARLSAAVCYYGGAIAPGKDKDKYGRTPPIGRVAELAVQTLLHYGGKDRSIDAEEHARVVAALSKAGKRYVVSVYPEAGHGFNCDERPSYDAHAAAEAWDLTLAFLARHSNTERVLPKNS